MSLSRRFRHWLVLRHVRHAVVACCLIATAGLLLNDAAIDSRLAASEDTPAAEVPVRASEAGSVPAPLYKDFAAALPANLAPGELHAISTSPLSILVLVPGYGGGNELTACFYTKLRWLHTPIGGATLTWIAPSGAVPMSSLETQRSCYGQPNDLAVNPEVQPDPVTGLTLVRQSLAPSGADDTAVQIVSAVKWHSPLLQREGYARRRLLFSYDSDVPDTLNRLHLQSLDAYAMDFSGTRSTGYGTSRQSGVDLLVAVRDTQVDRILSTSILSNNNTGLRATWRTSAQQPRYDIALTFENAPKRRELDARLQRSALIEGLVAPFLLTGATAEAVRSYRLRRSKRGHWCTVVGIALVAVTMALVVRLRLAPDFSDPILRLVTGA